MRQSHDEGALVLGIVDDVYSTNLVRCTENGERHSQRLEEQYSFVAQAAIVKRLKNAVFFFVVVVVNKGSLRWNWRSSAREERDNRVQREIRELGLISQL